MHCLIAKDNIETSSLTGKTVQVKVHMQYVTKDFQARLRIRAIHVMMHGTHECHLTTSCHSIYSSNFIEQKSLRRTPNTSL